IRLRPERRAHGDIRGNDSAGRATLVGRPPDRGVAPVVWGQRQGGDRIGRTRGNTTALRRETQLPQVIQRDPIMAIFRYGRARRTRNPSPICCSNHVDHPCPQRNGSNPSMHACFSEVEISEPGRRPIFNTPARDYGTAGYRAGPPSDPAGRWQPIGAPREPSVVHNGHRPGGSFLASSDRSDPGRVTFHPGTFFGSWTEETARRSSGHAASNGP